MTVLPLGCCRLGRIKLLIDGRCGVALHCLGNVLIAGKRHADIGATE
jgi:hypothetical protein